MPEAQPIVVSPEAEQEAQQLLADVTSSDLKLGQIQERVEITEELKNKIIDEILRWEVNFGLAGVAHSLGVGYEQVVAIYNEIQRKRGY